MVQASTVGLGLGHGEGLRQAALRGHERRREADGRGHGEGARGRAQGGRARGGRGLRRRRCARPRRRWRRPRSRKALDAPRANIELFRKHEAEIKKYTMHGLEMMGSSPDIHGPHASGTTVDASARGSRMPRGVEDPARPPRAAPARSGGGGKGSGQDRRAAAASSRPARTSSLRDVGRGQVRLHALDQDRVLGEVAAVRVDEPGAGADGVGDDAVAGLRDHHVGRSHHVLVAEPEARRAAGRPITCTLAGRAGAAGSGTRHWKAAEAPSTSGRKPGRPMPPKESSTAGLASSPRRRRASARATRGRRATRGMSSTRGNTERSPAKGSRRSRVGLRVGGRAVVRGRGERGRPPRRRAGRSSPRRSSRGRRRARRRGRPPRRPGAECRRARRAPRRPGARTPRLATVSSHRDAKAAKRRAVSSASIDSASRCARPTSHSSRRYVKGPGTALRKSASGAEVTTARARSGARSRTARKTSAVRVACPNPCPETYATSMARPPSPLAAGEPGDPNLGRSPSGLRRGDRPGPRTRASSPGDRRSSS